MKEKTDYTLKLCPPWRQMTSLSSNYGEHSFSSTVRKSFLEK